MAIVDFDGVSYHLSTLDDDDAKLNLSIRWKCWKELVQYGAIDVLKREYSRWIVEPEHGYDFTLQFDLENIGGDPGNFLPFASSSILICTLAKTVMSTRSELLGDIFSSFEENTNNPNIVVLFVVLFSCGLDRGCYSQSVIIEAQCHGCPFREGL